MTWTYNPAVVSTTDQVRLLVGDTDSSDPQLQDEEIAWLLSSRGNAVRAAIAACRLIAARYARQMDKALGSMRINAERRMDHYTRLADQVRYEYIVLGATPYAGGQSLSDKQVDETDSDRTPPYFTRMTGVNPGATPGLSPTSTTSQQEQP